MNQYLLSKGAHERAEDGRCAMEWVSYLAGEPHSDQPVCVSAVLKTFCIRLNDALPDGQRQRLRPYLARTIGTVGDGLDDQRGWQCMDWLIRVYTPAFLELVPDLAADAAALRSLPPVLASENVGRAMEELGRSRQRAAAARAVAWDAARDAAWDVAWDAAWAVARVVARVVAWAVARDAAWAAAWDAARAAAWAALDPVVAKLQDSILTPGGLLDQMLPGEVIQLPVVEEWREICKVGV